MIRGIISIVIGGSVFAGLFFWNKSTDLMTNLFSSVVACILGYIVVSSFIMTDKEMEDFEEKVDKFLEDKEKREKK